MEPWVSILTPHKPGVMGYTPGTLERESGGQGGVQGQPELPKTLAMGVGWGGGGWRCGPAAERFPSQCEALGLILCTPPQTDKRQGGGGGGDSGWEQPRPPRSPCGSAQSPAAQSLEGRRVGPERGEALAAAVTPRAKCSLDLGCAGVSQPPVMLCEVGGQKTTPTCCHQFPGRNGVQPPYSEITPLWDS